MAAVKTSCEKCGVSWIVEDEDRAEVVGRDHASDCGRKWAWLSLYEQALPLRQSNVAAGRDEFSGISLNAWSKADWAEAARQHDKNAFARRMGAS